MSIDAHADAARPSSFRWLQLAFGIVCMVMIANLQYGWTLFVLPIDAKYQWGRAAIQVAFSIFVLTETWLVPIEGWFVDRFGDVGRSGRDMRLSRRRLGRFGGGRFVGVHGDTRSTGGLPLGLLLLWVELSLGSSATARLASDIASSTSSADWPKRLS